MHCVEYSLRGYVFLLQFKELWSCFSKYIFIQLSSAIKHSFSTRGCWMVDINFHFLFGTLLLCGEMDLTLVILNVYLKSSIKMFRLYRLLTCLAGAGECIRRLKWTASFPCNKMSEQFQKAWCGHSDSFLETKQSSYIYFSHNQCEAWGHIHVILGGKLFCGCCPFLSYGPLDRNRNSKKSHFLFPILFL